MAVSTTVGARQAPTAAAFTGRESLTDLLYGGLHLERNKLFCLFIREAGSGGERTRIHKALELLGCDPEDAGQAVDVILKVARRLVRKDLLHKGTGSTQRPEDAICWLAHILVVGLPVAGLADDIAVEDGTAS